jgi:hypothetical protein
MVQNVNSGVNANARTRSNSAGAEETAKNRGRGHARGYDKDNHKADRYTPSEAAKESASKKNSGKDIDMLLAEADAAKENIRRMFDSLRMNTHGMHGRRRLSASEYLFGTMSRMVENMVGGSVGSGQRYWASKAGCCGNFKVSEEARLKAQEMISEDGYFGVAKTTERIMEFAKALGGENADGKTIDTLWQATKKGFEAAAAHFGGMDNLPEVSKKTYEAVNKAFEEWKNGSVKDGEEPKPEEAKPEETDKNARFGRHHHHFRRFKLRPFCPGIRCVRFKMIPLRHARPRGRLNIKHFDKGDNLLRKDHALSRRDFHGVRNIHGRGNHPGAGKIYLGHLNYRNGPQAPRHNDWGGIRNDRFDSDHSGRNERDHMFH